MKRAKFRAIAETSCEHHHDADLGTSVVPLSYLHKNSNLGLSLLEAGFRRFLFHNRNRHGVPAHPKLRRATKLVLYQCAKHGRVRPS